MIPRVNATGTESNLAIDAVSNQLKTEEGEVLVLSSRLIQGQVGRKRHYTEAMPGTGRPRQAWVEYTNEYLDAELERLIEIGVKISRSLL